MTDDELQEIIDDFPTFAETFLSISTKEAGQIPFKFKRAQHYLHRRLEEQLKAVGYVRAIIVKGRQGGCSTYTEGRFFHKAVTKPGVQAFILTHEAEATDNLFGMTKNFYDKMQENWPGVIPHADTKSAKKLKFDFLDSGFSVATAGNKSAGRSKTIHLFHGSEVAYWPNAESHAAGVLQAVSNKPGTEIILESTADGINNYFHSVWVSAKSGQSDFQAIFIPWYWDDDYKSDPQPNTIVSLTDEEQDYLDTYGHDGLTVEHLYWRRRKLLEFSHDHDTALERFQKEYPMNADEAFRNPLGDVFIKPNLVLRARKANVNSESPLVIGVDPAISGNDRTAIIRRKGRLAYQLETHYKLNTMEIVGLVRRIIDRERPAKVCIDCIGIGAGIVDRLLELGYECVEGVNVARSPNSKDEFRNLRAELWHDMREWFAQEMPVQIPDSDELHGDLTSLGYKFDSSGRLQIESKEDLKKRGMLSPDSADALALTFIVGDYLTSSAHTPNFLPKKSAGMFT